jgi:hypothetical protein
VEGVNCVYRLPSSNLIELTSKEFSIMALQCARALRLPLALAMLTAAHGALALDPIDYVPSDTPYVFANIDRTPANLSEKMAAMYPIGMYAEILQNALDADESLRKSIESAERAKAEADGEEAEEVSVPSGEPMQPNLRRVMEALQKELTGKKSILEFSKSIGLRSDGKWAFYGVGIFPVMRLELGDAKLFEAFIARLEKAHGEKIRKSESGGRKAWIFGDEKAQLELAIESNQLVGFFIPTKADANLRKALAQAPAKALGSAGLTSFNRSQGFSGFGSGYVDFVRITQSLTGSATNNEKAFFKALGEEMPSTTPACRDEIVGIATNMPRLTLGVTRLDGKSMDMRVVLEAKPSLAKEMQALSIGSSSLNREGMFSFGMALDPMKSVQFLTAQAQKIVDAPYQCENLLEMNESAKNAIVEFSKAPLAMLGGFKGFSMALHELKFNPETKTPDSMVASLAITSDAPIMLVGMAQATVPQLAGLVIKPDGVPLKLNSEGLPEMFEPSFLVMTNKMLGVGNGPAAEKRLADLATRPIAATGPFLTASVSGGFYNLMADVMEIAPMDSEAEKRMMNSVQQSYRLIAKMIKMGEVRMNFTPKGIEMYQAMQFN